MNLVELKRLAFDWVAPELLEARPKLVFLDGPMGSGKTTFVGFVASQLGSEEAASPSFSLHSRYTGHRGVIDHFDLDRLQSIDELESIGFWDLLEEAKNDSRRFVMIEWATRLEEFGVRGSQWHSGFHVWRIAFSGPPEWTVQII